MFHSPENLAFALRKFHDYHTWRESRVTSGFGSERPMSDAQSALANELGERPGATLSEYEAKRIIEQWGVPIVNERQASTANEAVEAARDMGFPVVIKVKLSRHTAQDRGRSVASESDQ